MAFLKVEKKKSGSYLSVVETYRNESGTPCHRRLFNLGKVEDYRPETLKKMGKRLYELGGGDVKDLLGEEMQELARYNYGYAQVYSKLIKAYRLDKLWQRITKRHDLKMDLANSILLLLLDRLSEPCSKLCSYDLQSEYLEMPPLSLHWLYRCLDYLDKYSQQIQKQIFNTGRTLFNMTLDVVFYDVSTFYFDSEVEQEGKLRQKGFGKDGKIGKTQVVFSMLIDKDKRPIAYEVYHGKTYEGHTFEDAIKRLKKTYQIGKVIIVADRGMLNKANIELVEKTKTYEYIIGERLKNLPKADQKKLLDLSKYTQEFVMPGTAHHQTDTEQDAVAKDIKIKYTTLKKGNKTIIGTWSAKRARKDEYKRKEKIAKAEDLLKTPGKITSKAKRYYLKEKGISKEATQNKSYEIDWQKIEEQKKYDGFVAIATNAKGIEVPDILDQYRHLYQIEHTFRTFKSYLEARPMFHWKDERIRGHLCLCYIAYTLMNHLQLELKQAGKPHTERHIRRSLKQMQVSLIEQGYNQFYMRSKMNAGQHDILNVLKIKKIPNLSPKNAMKKYINWL